MKKRIGLIILLITMMVLASGCEVSHSTKVDKMNLQNSTQKISELRVK